MKKDIKGYSKTEILSRLRKEIAALGTQRAFADKHGIDSAFLSDVLNGRRDPSDSLLEPFGLKRTFIAVEK